MSADSDSAPAGQGRSPRRPTILLGLIAALALTAIIVFASRPETGGSATSTTLPTSSESSSTAANTTTPTPTPTTPARPVDADSTR